MIFSYLRRLALLTGFAGSALSAVAAPPSFLHNRIPLTFEAIADGRFVSSDRRVAITVDTRAVRLLLTAGYRR